MVVSMQSLTDTTLVLGGDASLDLVLLHPIQPMVEGVVVPMKSSADPTLLLESDNSKEVTLPMQSSVNPTLLLGVMILSTMYLAFIVLYLLHQGAFHSL
jgi:hypothetical protein